MMYVTATKEFSWDMAHMLAGHEGLCVNLHGHTYKMQVTVQHKPPHVLEAEGPAQDMVVDFKELKEIVQRVIIDPLDHAFMGWEHSPDTCEQLVIGALRKTGRKLQLVGYRPTAENMAINFLMMLRRESMSTSYQVICVRVWETPTSFSEAML